jgi:aspartyl protease family protein
MATGFMPHFMALCLLLAAPASHAAEVALIGVIGNKAAVLSIGGGEPKTVKVGDKWNGIGVLAVEKDRASVEIDGKRRVLMLGQHQRSAAAPSSRDSVTLGADPRGHFIAMGEVNGIPIRFLVDTGATAIALPASEAQRLGIDYRKGERGMVQTANGTAPVYRVKLDTVKLGSIELQSVEALVTERGLSIPLLGMSFLNRVEMKRDGDTMTLIRRF